MQPELGPAVDGWCAAAPPAPVRLTGGHVLLRPVDPDADAEALWTAAAGDPHLWTYLPDGPYADADELREALALLAGGEERVSFAVVPRAGGTAHGSASYLRAVPEHGSIEIGHIWFGAPLQRTTAATEAIHLLAAHAFDELGYRRLEWKCDALNARSRRAAERFGFSYEGTFRSHLVVKGRSRDTAWYSITDAEWPAVNAAFRSWLDRDNFDEHGRQRRSLEQLRAVTSP